MDGWRATHLDEIAAEQWPYWAPIRHHFGIEAFGVNAWRGEPGEEVVKRHDETGSGHEELYLVLSGRATFTIGGETLDAPAGRRACASTCATRRSSASPSRRSPGTVVLSLGSKPGAAYEGGWDTGYLEG